jgi:hypothetical protein
MLFYDASSPFCLKADPYVPVYDVVTVEDVIEEGSTTPVINKDANTLTVEGATIDYNATITGQLGDNPSFVAQNPSIATVDDNGNVTRVSDGTAKIRASSRGNNQILSVPVSRDTGVTTSGFSSWRSGTLAKMSDDRTNAIVSGLTASATTRALFNYPSSPSLPVRNPGAFLHPNANATCAIAESVNGSSWMGFTAITKRHVVAVAHIGNYTGLKAKFVDPSSNRYERTLTQRYEVPGVDVAVYLLDSDLPFSVNPVPLLPTTALNYIPNTQYPVPMVFVDRNNYGNICRTLSLTSSTLVIAPIAGARGTFYNTPVEGTSGKPILIHYGSLSGQMALVALFTYSGSGPALHALNWSEIIPAVDIMAGISTGYQPARANLSSFTSYA